MYTLWQWHKATAIGEKSIIERAQIAQLEERAYHLAMALAQWDTIETIADAIRYFENSETGSVAQSELWIDQSGELHEDRIPREYELRALRGSGPAEEVETD